MSDHGQNWLIKSHLERDSSGACQDSVFSQSFNIFIYEIFEHIKGMLIQFVNTMTLGIIKLLDKHVTWMFRKTKPRIETCDRDSEIAGIQGRELASHF